MTDRCCYRRCFLTFQLYADGEIAFPPAMNCESRDSGRMTKSTPVAANSTADRPKVALRPTEDDSDGEKTEDEDAAFPVDGCLQGVPDVPSANRIELPPTVDNIHNKGDDDIRSTGVVVACKPASSPPRPHVFVPRPAASARCIGSGGSACESVSPTRGPVPLHQPSGLRNLPTDDAADPDPLPGSCPSALSSLPVLPTSSAVDQLAGSRAYGETDGATSSTTQQVSSRSTKRHAEDGVEHAIAKARRRLVTDDIAVCRLEYCDAPTAKVRF
jgi:hypothetical protein